MTQYKRIEAWARSLGSKAKTREGQRKAIMASFKLSDGIRALIDGRITHTQYRYVRTRAEYMAQRTRSRQERFAANHPLTLSMPAPARKSDMISSGQLEQMADFPTNLAVSDLTPNHDFAKVGDWYISLKEIVSWDNNRYSKSWHRAHGGAKSVDSRSVWIRRVAANGTLEKRDIEVSAWRGNFLLNALIDSGVVDDWRGARTPSKLKPVQLHNAFFVKPIREGALSIYERTLVVEPNHTHVHYDYCALWHGITFHAATIKAAVRGLRQKMQTVIAQRNAPITWELGKTLGFCEEGMRQFARDFGLDVKGHYSPAQIESAVRANLQAAAPYRTELVRLAGAVGYEIPTNI